MNDTWLTELREFIAIPSVSADPAHQDDLRRAAEWVRDFVKRTGGEAELVPKGTRDLVIGDIPANSNGGRAPTVLIYGHFDVQPPAPLDLWESPPFELDERDGWFYARGIADDKGQLYTLLDIRGAEPGLFVQRASAFFFERSQNPTASGIGNGVQKAIQIGSGVSHEIGNW